MSLQPLHDVVLDRIRDVTALPVQRAVVVRSGVWGLRVLEPHGGHSHWHFWPSDGYLIPDPTGEQALVARCWASCYTLPTTQRHEVRTPCDEHLMHVVPPPAAPALTLEGVMQRAAEAFPGIERIL